MAGEKEYYLDLSLAEPSLMVAAKTVLAYESAYRGVSMGQAALRLLRQGIDEVAYPEEVREQLRGIRESMRRRAAGEAALAIGRARSS